TGHAPRSGSRVVDDWDIRDGWRWRWRFGACERLQQNVAAPVDGADSHRATRRLDDGSDQARIPRPHRRGTSGNTKPGPGWDGNCPLFAAWHPLVPDRSPARAREVRLKGGRDEGLAAK